MENILSKITTANVNPFRRRSSETRQSKKKALLIAINYSTGANDLEDLSLKGPHRDAHRLRELLINRYNYRAEDIKMLMDDSNHALPTTMNILNETQNLVKEARSGDSFLFYFAGHGDQQPDPSHVELDDKNETIVSIDSFTPDMDINDDKLKELLVNNLPVGSNLTAIFDACHSGTLLDLDHYECNRVWVPFISKRWKLDQRRNAVVRENGVAPSRRATHSQGRIEVFHRVGSKEVNSRQVSFDILPASFGKRKRFSVRARSLTMEAAVMMGSQPCSPVELPWFDRKGEICSSPVSNWACPGSRMASPERNAPRAHVTSIAACSDNQRTYETSDGNQSMTEYLIQILDGNPHPSLRDLMTRLSHKMYAAACERHQWNRKRRKERKGRKDTKDIDKMEEKDDDDDIEFEEFQEPQLGSQHKINLDNLFTL